MEEDTSEFNCPPLPLSCLRLFVPPLRLVAAAIWQTVEKKVVADYGLVEEFISTVVEIVPDLINRRQIAQLVLGLRARLVLELCQFEETSELGIIQPHLDRMETLSASWDVEEPGSNVELPNSNFRDRVHTLLKEPEERENFFQNVFPEEFGPKYDEELNTLTWQFLSRLEMLLNLQTLQQVASMLCFPSFLRECLESVSHCQDLQTLLRYQNDLSQLEESGYSVEGAHIASTLSLCSMYRTIPENDKLHAESHISPIVYSSSSDMEKASIAPLHEKSGKTELATENARSEAQEVERNKGKNSVFLKQCRVLFKRLDVPLSLNSRPVRPNRGQKMKMILLQEKGHSRKQSPSPAASLHPCIETQMLLSNSESALLLPGKMSEDAAATADMSDNDSVGSLKDPPYMLPVNEDASSEDGSFSNCSDAEFDYTCPEEEKVTSAKSKVRGGSRSKAASANKTHSSGQRGRCYFCKEQVTGDMKEHMETHFPNGELTCPRCETTFKRLASFKQHLRRTCLHSEEVEATLGEYKCDECEKAFKYKLSLDEHKRTHNKLYCEVCKKVLRDAETVERHKGSHIPFQCTMCEENFRLYKPLAKHYESAHKLRRPFKCHHCTKSFSALRLFIRHEWTHTGQFPLQCPQCPRKFRNDPDLVSHMRVHTREKPFLCPICGRAFAASSNLRRHLNIKHSKAREGQKLSSSQHNKSSQTSVVAAGARAAPETSGNASLNPVAHVGISTEDGALLNSSDKDPESLPTANKDFSAADNVQQGVRVKMAATYKTKHPRPRGRCCICKEHVKQDMKEHMKTHFPNGELACPRCDSKFKLLTSLKLHLRRTCYDQQQLESEEVEGTCSVYKCDECEKAFRYKLSLDEHKRTHNELYCEVCKKVLRDAETVARHNSSHMPFQCTLCEQNFRLYKPLAKHVENVHNLISPYKCHHCPKTFTVLRLFIRHEWKHTGQLPFQCSQCLMKFRNDVDLVSHLRVHTREKPFLCADCGKTFSSSSNLRRHLNFKHSQSRRRFSCSQCDKSFKEKGALKKHEQRKHQHQMSRYPCMYCGKLFSASAMARHKLIHTGEKPYKCKVPECEKYFRSTSEMKTHTLRHHTKERPFKCDVCGKGFIRACFLNEHVTIHSGEKPYVCFVCGKAFPKIYSMRRHKKLMHAFQAD